MGGPADPTGRAGRATMNDVAARASVSLKTVSRVVNGEAGVLPEPTERVVRAIAELGFRRNDSARQLRTGRTAGIGLILEDVADPFYSVLTRAVEQVVRATRLPAVHRVLRRRPGPRAGTRPGAVRPPGGRPGHGARRAPTTPIWRPELSAGLPVVFVDRPPINLAADAVLTDNAGGVRAGVSHLVAGGHRRIGYLGDAPVIFTAQERLGAYRRTMAEAGPGDRPEWVAMGRAGQDDVRASLDRMLGGPTPITALFTGNNRLTVAVLRELAGRRGARRWSVSTTSNSPT